MIHSVLDGKALCRKPVYNQRVIETSYARSIFRYLEISVHKNG